MRHNPHHADTDPETVRRLVREFPWGTLVSPTSEGLVASHYPLMLDEAADGLVLLTHMGRPDDQIHELGHGREMLIIVQGRHGYISPSWYAPDATRAPTWNHTTTHLHGVPELLDEDANLDVLTRLVAHFERHVEEPMYLDREWGRPAATGTVGLRIPVTRFITKRKLSADKDPQTQRQVIEHLRAPGPYHDPGLAEDMVEALGQSTSVAP